MALDSEAKRWSMLRVSDPGLVINPSGSNLDSEVERLTLLRVYGGLTVSDTTAPVLSSPTGTATGTTTADGTVDTDEGNGTLYFWATGNASETAANIKANGDSQAVVATGTQNVSFTGLTAETTYYAHYVHDDAASNESNVVSSDAFTTESAVQIVDVDGKGTYKRGWRRGRAKKLFDDIERSLQAFFETPSETIGLKKVQTEKAVERSVNQLKEISFDHKGFKRRLVRIEKELDAYQAKRRQELERDDEDMMMMH